MGRPGSPRVLRPPLGARGREREKGPLGGAPFPFSAAGPGSALICWWQGRGPARGGVPKALRAGRARPASPTHVGLSVSVRRWFSF